MPHYDPSAPISVPVYDPSPYALHGLAFDQLPPACRDYLTFLQLQPATPLTTIHYRRQLLAEELWRSIQGVDMALITKIVEARQAANTPRHHHSLSEWYASTAEQDRLRVNQVFGVLLPERQRHFDRFMDKFDALFWLEMELVPGGEGTSEDEARKRRDELCTPVLRHASDTMRDLGREVMHLLSAQKDPFRYSQKQLALQA